MNIVPEACACVVHVRAWRSVMSIVFLHTHVDQRVVWHNISTLCFSMCVLLSLRFHGFGAVHCERLRVSMCVLSFSSLVCICHCWVCLFDGYAEDFLIWQLMWSCMQHQRMSVQF